VKVSRGVKEAKQFVSFSTHTYTYTHILHPTIHHAFFAFFCWENSVCFLVVVFSAVVWYGGGGGDTVTENKVDAVMMLGRFFGMLSLF